MNNGICHKSKLLHVYECPECNISPGYPTLSFHNLLYQEVCIDYG